MTWTKVSDDTNDRYWSLSHGAYRLHLAGIVDSNRCLSDGYMPLSRLPALMPDYEPVYLAELIDAGLWEAWDGGYHIKEFLVDQPSKAEVEKRRKDTRDKVASWRASHPRNPVTPAVTGGVTEAVTPGTGDSLVRSTRTRSHPARNPVTDTPVCDRCGVTIADLGGAIVVGKQGQYRHQTCHALPPTPDRQHDSRPAPGAATQAARKRAPGSTKGSGQVADDEEQF